MKHLLYPLVFLGAACCALSQVAETSGAPFTVTITPLKAQFKLGEPAMIHIVMKNVSKQPIDVPEERHLGRGEMNYNITVTTIDGSSVSDSDLVKKRKAGYTAGQRSQTERELNYGDELKEDADLNNVVKISTPGDYVVQVERADYQWGSLHVRSNQLVVHIVP